MISPSYSFRHFAETVRGKDVFTVIYLAEQEATEAWRKTYRKRGVYDDTELRSCSYQLKLIGLIDFLRHGIAPKRALEDEEFLLFDGIARHGRQ